jgi:hypothetical protein
VVAKPYPSEGFERKNSKFWQNDRKYKYKLKSSNQHCLHLQGERLSKESNQKVARFSFLRIKHCFHPQVERVS